MKTTLENNIFHHINQLEEKVDMLEKKIQNLKAAHLNEITLLKTQVVRIKNHEQLSDDYIFNSRPYHDLSPERAMRLYNDRDHNFFMLDVSRPEYQPLRTFSEAINIPLEELSIRHREIGNKQATIFVISEDGTRSILACDLLYKAGFYNLNHVSGGYKYWPAPKSKTQEPKIA